MVIAGHECGLRSVGVGSGAELRSCCRHACCRRIHGRHRVVPSPCSYAMTPEEQIVWVSVAVCLLIPAIAMVIHLISTL